jgi:hypothetical protein
MAARRREWWAGETAAVVGGLAQALSKRRRSDGATDRHSMSPLPKDLTPVVPTWYWKPAGIATRSPGVSQAEL